MNQTAKVEVLTAEVRVLMVGKRQVTLSVYRQLDWVDPALCEPFGRTNDPRESSSEFSLTIDVVGRHAETGDLVRSRRRVSRDKPKKWVGNVEFREHGRTNWREWTDEELAYAIEKWRSDFHAIRAWEVLPLIVLAGLT